jgi:hypothetical protein
MPNLAHPHVDSISFVVAFAAATAQDGDDNAAITTYGAAEFRNYV